MADENLNDDKKKGGEFKVPPRNYILWIAILGLIPLLMLFRNNATSQGEALKLNQFLEKYERGNIASGTINYDPQSPLQEIRGKYYATDAEGNRVMENGRPKEVAFTANVRLPNNLEEKLLYSG